jgi:hypothetical protein
MAASGMWRNERRRYFLELLLTEAAGDEPIF